MARSVYIYLVQRDGDPLAAFTVKHELINWLKRQPIVADLTVFKLADNPWPFSQSVLTNPTPNVQHVPLTALGWPC